MKDNSTTREDVALGANVSGSTVSLALRGDRRVSARTRRLVRSVARQNGLSLPS